MSLYRRIMDDFFGEDVMPEEVELYENTPEEVELYENIPEDVELEEVGLPDFDMPVEGASEEWIKNFCEEENPKTFEDICPACGQHFCRDRWGGSCLCPECEKVFYETL